MQGKARQMTSMAPVESVCSLVESFVVWSLEFVDLYSSTAPNFRVAMGICVCNFSVHYILERAPSDALHYT